MYGGPRNPNSSPFQGGSRPLPQNFRPRFENPGFPPQPHPNAYWDFRPRQPYPPSTHLQRPFGMITHPQEPGGTFQPREWQMSVPRRGFPPAGNHDQQRTRVWNYSPFLHGYDFLKLFMSLYYRKQRQVCIFLNHSVTKSLFFPRNLYWSALSIFKKGRGGHRRNQDSSGIEAYYRHSMVEDPWKELEEQYIRKNQQA